MMQILTSPEVQQNLKNKMAATANFLMTAYLMLSNHLMEKLRRYHHQICKYGLGGKSLAGIEFQQQQSHSSYHLIPDLHTYRIPGDSFGCGPPTIHVIYMYVVVLKCDTVKPVTRGHLSGCLNCILCEPKFTLTLKCTCDEGTPVM